MKLLTALSVLLCAAVVLADVIESIEGVEADVAELVRDLEDFSSEPGEEDGAVDQPSTRALGGIGTCSCSGNQCNCCLKIAYFKVCLEVQYAGSTIKVSFKYNGKSVFSTTLPVRDSGSLCVRIKGIKVCAELYGVKIQGGKLNACLKLTKPFGVKFGCLKIGMIQPIVSAISVDVTKYEALFPVDIDDLLDREDSVYEALE